MTKTPSAHLVLYVDEISPLGYKLTGCARRDLQVPEVVLRLSFYGRVIVREASLFCESL